MNASIRLVSEGTGARTVVVHHSGRDFFSSASMAEIFHRRSREVIASGHAELVPLLHFDGVELLLVGLETTTETHEQAPLLKAV